MKLKIIIVLILSVFTLFSCASEETKSEDNQLAIDSGTGDEGITTDIIIFNAGTNDGLIADHQGRCDAEKVSQNIIGDNVAPFISTDSKAIMDVIPVEYGNQPVKGPNGTIISNDWNSLWSGSIVNDLSTAGAIPFGTNYWWSGSKDNGTVDSKKCFNWTDGSSGYEGVYGDANQMDSSWIFNFPSYNCNFNSYYILCTAW